MGTPITIETTLCEADRALLNEVKANQERILMLLTTGDPSKNWIKGKEARKRLGGVCAQTLRNWADKDLIVYDKTRRRFLEESVIQMQKKKHIKPAA